MSNPSHAGSGAHDHGGLGHAVPMRILLGTWALLVVLTVVTVGATYVDLGEMNIFLAMGIAVVKSTFVALYFMHLRWDKPFHSIVFVSAALFVMLFISLALLDTRQYAPDKIAGYAPEIEAVAAETAAAAEADGHGTAAGH
jgi:cytochrome c oxidase subunit 4